MSFLNLVIIIAILLVVLKILQATGKIIIVSVCIAAAVWFILYILPELGVY